MKKSIQIKITYLLLALLVLPMSSCKENSKSNQVTAETRSQATTMTSGDKIEVIDFYGTHRCITCKAIEANAKYTVETYFKDKPMVSFKTVNVDDDANYAMAEKYEATGTALFLNVVKNGVEQHIDLTDFAFSKGKDQQVFSYELKNKIDVVLKKM